jgi:hypothetical protein
MFSGRAIVFITLPRLDHAGAGASPLTTVVFAATPPDAQSRNTQVADDSRLLPER